MKKMYVVIATMWSDEEKACVEYEAGTFGSWHNASLFRDAYNNFYNATARIEERRIG